MNVIESIRRNLRGCLQLPSIIESQYTATHEELWDRVDRLSEGLRSLGLRKGDALIAWLPNGHEAIEAELACLQSGLVWVTVNTRFTWNEVREIIADCRPKAMITDRERAEKLEPPESLAIPILLTGFKEGYEEAVVSHNPRRPDVKIAETDLARLRYTSGTTGKPKAAMIPHRVYAASLKNLQGELHPLSSEDRVLHLAPLTHAGGALVFPILAAGGANVFIPSADAESALDAIEEHCITTMFLVPTLLQRLAASPTLASRDLISLKSVVYGGAPTPTEKLVPILDKFGKSLIHIFGMTEAPYPITTLQREEHWCGNPKLGSIGKPTSICKLKIVRDDGIQAGNDEIGELFVAGENVMDGYWNDPIETAKVLKDGWLATGDLARRDPDEYYWIVDRKKDVIISGGFNVYAAEVEIALASHAAVAEAAVLGIPHAEWGESVVAHVAFKAGQTASTEELIAWCRKQLAGYKCPRTIEIHAELPKNSSGKIAKHLLRASHPSVSQ